MYHVEQTKSNNKIKIDILGTIATKVVVTVGIASYTPGLQEWKGAADILNKNPTVKITIENCIVYW